MMAQLVYLIFRQLVAWLGLLDELSAVLVHQLALRRAATVVLTLRTGETAPDAVTALTAHVAHRTRASRR